MENNIKRNPNCPQRAITVGYVDWPNPLLAGECDSSRQGWFIIPDVAIGYAVIGGKYKTIKRSYLGNIAVKCYGMMPEL